MSKLSLNRLTSSFGFKAAFNNILQQIENEFSNNVLYRKNPLGEPNSMSVDIDMGSHDLLNVGLVSAKDFRINGTTLTQSLQDTLEEVAAYPAEAKGYRDEALVYRDDAQAASISALASAELAETTVDSLSASGGSSLVGFLQSGTGAVARTAQAKMRERVTTADFGLSGTDYEGLRSTMGNAHYPSPAEYGAVRAINGTDSTSGVFDVANLAGQGELSGIPTGFVLHHYTDGVMAQMDNVGTGKILVLKNAKNTTRRADEGPDYVGTGTFLSLNEHDNALGYTRELFFIDKLARLIWTGVKGTVSFIQNKLDDASFAFQHSTTYAHRFVSRYVNAGKQVLSIENDVSYTRAVIKSAATQTLGLYIASEAGNILLYSAGGEIRTANPIKSNSGNLTLGVATTGAVVEVQTPLKPRSYNASGDLPAASSYSGCIAMLAGILIYSNGVNWKYVRDDAVIV